MRANGPPAISSEAFYSVVARSEPGAGGSIKFKSPVSDRHLGGLDHVGPRACLEHPASAREHPLAARLSRTTPREAWLQIPFQCSDGTK